MKKYKKIYFEYYNIGEQDIVLSEVSGKLAVDIHHILPKGRGGKDNIENLIALTREEHNYAHKGKLTQDFLQKIHNNNL